MSLTDLGKNFICANFGASQCCVATGLSWYYTVGGIDYAETGGTAQAVSRLASGLVNSITMTNPATGTFTQANLNTANGASVTLADCQEITSHDEPSEDQWCFISCESITDQSTCEIYGCYWYNGGCHSNPPSCEGLNNPADCVAYGCYWYDGACHSSWTCENISNATDCLTYGCNWYNNGCHTVDQPELCYWVDAKGGPAAIVITDVFEMVDSYLFTAPPPGYSFVPTLQNTFGVIDYFLGFNGDALTGCVKFV